MLVVHELSRKLDTLEGLRDKYAVSGSSNDRRRAAALSAAVEALRYHAAEVEKERRVIPLFVRLLDAAMEFKHWAEPGRAVAAMQAANVLEETITEALPVAEEVR